MNQYEIQPTDGPMAAVLCEALHILQEDQEYRLDQTSAFSCDCLFAYNDIYDAYHRDGLYLRPKFVAFLKENGLDTTDSRHSFDDIPEGEQRQGARFQWLSFLLEIAREEGL